jgi:hypothetical protein
MGDVNENNVATPPFMPGQIPGIGGGGAVPGVPAAPQGQTAPDPNQKAQQILATLMQAAGRKQMANTAVPAAIPAGGDAAAAGRIGMDTAWPKAWGTQRFLGTIGANIKSAVAQQKQKQLAQAEGDWTTLQAYMNEKFEADQSGDQAASQAAQKKLDFILGDPKKLKNMAKALNQDWLNPEKTTVYGEALKNVTKKQQAEDQKKEQKVTAAQKLKDTFMKVLGQKQQLQLTAEQQRKMIQEIQSKAPTTQTGIDKESAAALREEMKAEERAASEEHKAMLKQQEDERKAAEKQKEMELKQEQEKETLEMKNKFQTMRDQNQNQFHETMQRLHDASAEQRQNAHDMMMMKALGMKLDAQTEKMFKPDPTKLNKDVTDSVSTLKSQLSQAQSALKSLKTSASNHWIMGPGKDEISGAQEDVDKLQKAIEHIERNRDSIIKGKADLGDVVNKAYDIMGGGSSDVPGFVPDKK